MSTDSNVNPSDIISLKITTLTGKIIPIKCSKHILIESLKQLIENSEGIPIELQRLIFAGKELMVGTILNSYNVEDSCVIHLVLRKNDTILPMTQPINVQSSNQRQGEALPLSDEEYARRLQSRDFFYARPMYPGVAPFPQMGNNGQVVLIPQPPRNRNNDDDELSNNGDRLYTIFKLSKSIRMFSILDIIFLIIWSLSYFIFFVGIFFILAGYYGANYYYPNYTLLYALYIVVAIAFRIYLAYISDSVLYIVIVALGVLCELYILRLIYYFYKYGDLTDEDRTQLYAINYF